MFITRLDLKTYLIFKLRRATTNAKFIIIIFIIAPSLLQTTPVINNSGSFLLKNVERAAMRQSANITSRRGVFALYNQRQKIFKTEATDAFCLILNHPENTFAKRERALSLSVSVFFSEELRDLEDKVIGCSGVGVLFAASFAFVCYA